MAKYTYTIFDGNPAVSGGTALPSHEDVEIDAESDDEARETVRESLESEAAGLSTADGYEVGDTLYSLVWDEDGVHIERCPTHTLTAEDLGAQGAEKSDVSDWEAVATFVQTFPADDGDGACDVSVEIGSATGEDGVTLWFVRTTDDAGGADDFDYAAYSTREAAETAAEAYAEEHDEGDGEDAETYLRHQTEKRAGEPDPEGEWCVYWETALNDAGPRTRYATEAQAEAAAEIANADLRAAHRGGELLCGFAVRQLVDGEWVERNDGY